MADHALGTLMAMAALAGAMQVRLTSTTVTPPLIGPPLVGVSLAGLLVGMQFLFAGPGNMARLPAGKNADTGPGPDRQIAVLSGKLTLDVPTTPVLGSPDSPKLLVLLFDYCCPHCRATHGYLREGLPRYPGQLGVVLLPMPLDAKCNPSVDETEARFRESCDLIRLALAVWRAKPGAFAEFDAWLFEPEKPRALAGARAKAESLVGAQELEAALADPWIEETIRADVKAYDESGADTLPVIFSPGMDAVVGRPDSGERLFEILESELGLKRVEP
jgi:protein-disulfide isomerase